MPVTGEECPGNTAGVGDAGSRMRLPRNDGQRKDGQEQ
jgi:hypothetical protein